MKQLIFIKNYALIESILKELLSDDSKVEHIDERFAIIDLQKDINRKDMINRLRSKLDDDKKEIVQPVVNYVEKVDCIEVTLPNLTFYLNKDSFDV